jgi:hypothetical protein
MAIRKRGTYSEKTERLKVVLPHRERVMLLLILLFIEALDRLLALFQ